jgi:hypothetical protein
VTGFLEPTPTFSASDVDIASIRLNGAVPVDPAAPTALGDRNGNGTPDLMVKFDRAAVERTVLEGDDVRVDVSGMFGSQSFHGTDHIRVRRHGQASEAAVTAESPDETTNTPDGVPGASEMLPLEAMAGAGDPGPAPLELAIRRAAPNPAVGSRFWVEFVLRDGSPARLELMDVAGRVLFSRNVGALGPGAHALDLTGGDRRTPGIYFLRLRQGVSEVRARAVVLQ